MKRPLRIISVLGSLIALFAFSIAACSSSSSPASCNQNPFACPTGQTCWVGSGPDDYACFGSGRGVVGDPCTPLPGSPSCGDRLACVSSGPAGSPMGTCAAFCDPTNSASHGCPPGELCQSVTLPGGTQSFNACVAPTPDSGGAGPDAAGASDATSPPVDASTGNDTGNPGNDASGDVGSGGDGNNGDACGPLTTVTNCGDCGRACSTSGASATSCSTGSCAPTCNGGFSNCKTPAAPAPDDGCECATPACCNTGCAVTHKNCVGSSCGSGAQALGQSYFDAADYCLALGTPGSDSTYSQALATAAAAVSPPASTCLNPPCTGLMACPDPLDFKSNAYYNDTTGSGGPCYVWVFATESAFGSTSTSGYLSIDPNGCNCPLDTTFPTWN
jgi:hypothetical protein